MRVGEYELLEEIGRGGAGRVYRARARDGREVALKLLRVPSPGAAARFLREQRLQGAFGAGEGFVPLLDAGDDALGQPYLVLPLLAGGTLRQRLTQGPLSIEEARALGVRLARALGAAHARGIVHRDVKPQNVLFDRQGQAFLADLGLARHFLASSPERVESVGSRTGDFRGTPGYASPEQLMDAKRVGPPADVFALGVVLYEALAWRSPYPGASLLQVALETEQGRFTPLRQLRPEVPAALAATIERALAPDPGQRFADGEALARALEGEPAQPVPQGARGARAVTLALLGLAGLLGLGVSALLASRRPSGEGLAATSSGRTTDQRGVGEEPSPHRSPPLGSPLGSPPRSPLGGSAPAPQLPLPGAASGEGSLPAELLAAWAGSSAPLARAYGEYAGLLPSRASAVAPVPGREAVVILARGRQGAALGLSGPTVHDLSGGHDLAGGLQRRLEHAQARGLAVSPDGRRLVTSAEGELVVWDLEGGQRLATYEPALATVLALAISPDGQRLAYACAETPLQGDEELVRVELIDLQTGAHAPRLEGAPWASVRELAFLPGHAGPGPAGPGLDPGERLVAVGHEGEVQVWDLATRALTRQFDTCLQQEATALACGLDPAQELLVTCFAPGPEGLCFWDLREGRLLRREPTPGVEWPAGLLVGAGGLVVLVCVDGGVHRRLGPGSWREVARVEEAPCELALLGSELLLVDRRLQRVALDPAGARPATPMAPPQAHLGRVLVVAPTADGRRVVSVDDRELIEWDAQSGALLTRQRLHAQPSYWPVCFVGDTAERLLVADEQHLTVWERRDGLWSRRRLEWTDRGPVALRSSRDGQVILAQLEEGFRRVSLDGPPGPLQARVPEVDLVDLYLATDGQATLLRRSDRTWVVWDPVRGREVATASLPEWVDVLELRSEPLRLFCGDDAFRLRVVDMARMEVLHELPGQGGFTDALAVSPDGALLAAGDDEGRLVLWRPGEATPRWQLELGRCQDAASALAFTPDGQALLVGTRRGVVLRFDLTR